MVKKPSANARDGRDTGSVPGSRRFHAEGQYSCPEHPTDRGARRATVQSHKPSDMTEVTWHAQVRQGLKRLAIFHLFAQPTVKVKDLKRFITERDDDCGN